MKTTKASNSPALRLHKETLKAMSVKSGVRTGDVAPLPISRSCAVITWKDTLARG